MQAMQSQTDWDLKAHSFLSRVMLRDCSIDFTIWILRPIIGNRTYYNNRWEGTGGSYISLEDQSNVDGHI